MKVEPRPTSLCTQILPPWSATNLRQSANPRPVPSGFAALLPTGRNSSNTAARQCASPLTELLRPGQYGAWMELVLSAPWRARPVDDGSAEARGQGGAGDPRRSRGSQTGLYVSFYAPELLPLRDWLEAHRVTRLAMESTARQRQGGPAGRPRFLGLRAARLPCPRCRRHVVRCEEYNPSRRSSAPRSPALAQASAWRRTCSLYSAVNRRRAARSATSGSAGAAGGRSLGRSAAQEEMTRR